MIAEYWWKKVKKPIGDGDGDNNDQIRDRRVLFLKRSGHSFFVKWNIGHVCDHGSSLFVKYRYRSMNDRSFSGFFLYHINMHMGESIGLDYFIIILALLLPRTSLLKSD